MTARASGRLVFDSDLAAARVGRRPADLCGRTLLYRSERLVVDVLVHSGADELRLFHGQVVDRRSGSPVTEAHVSLAADDQIVTDALGQFSLSAMAADEGHVLRVRTPDHELLCTIPAHYAHG